ncbi:glucose-1-phosphate adenylyltransferase subunit GlgD [Salsuginibacillus kocurii]|uniref:glucose-1-phosphate adenylyltransferase subunit GlgD n=1 Tax=Salsuginibacillus kocurii TaxID=427078 RepID=UPI00036E981D|nr:glucose-1-phosphate adenylyltransferase subunit GlgD [Salsuginibacillus kocurii]
MKQMMGLINLEHERDTFQELTYFRCPAAIPFAGRYRLIDFTLSNMVRSGIQEVALFTNQKYRALMDHLGTGVHWGLARRHGGLFILPPDWHDPSDISRGDLRHFHNNRDYFHRSKADYVLVSGSQFIANTDYNAAFQKHLYTGADITLLTTETKLAPGNQQVRPRVELDEDDWVKSLHNDITNPIQFSGTYIIHKELLLELVDACIAYEKTDFFQATIKGNLHKLFVQTYHHTGYSAFIDSLESFYHQNMELLKPANYENMFLNRPPVLTKVSNEPPVKYGPNAQVSSSIVANGCVIEGTVENSVLFRGVHISPDTHIKDSIIMQRCDVASGVDLENVILDKDVHILENQRLIGSAEKPYTLAKRKVLV